MKQRGIISRLAVFLAIRRPRDWLTKMLPFVLFCCAANVGLREFLFGWNGSNLATEVAVVVVIATPFFGLFFSFLTELDKVQSRLSELAMQDVLTGIANRRAFVEKARHAISQSPEGTLLVFDADHFKRINDRFGHAVGDACLQAIARHLTSLLGEGDMLGRIGGEEFAIYLPHTRAVDLSPDTTTFTGPIALDAGSAEAPVRLTLSVGAAQNWKDSSLEALMGLADDAMYCAKRNGRAQLVVWKEGMDATPLLA